MRKIETAQDRKRKQLRNKFIVGVVMVGSVDLGKYYNEAVYFVNPGISSGPIFSNLGGYFLRYQEACLEGTECLNEGLPVKNCSDNIFVFEESGEESIEIDESCVYVRGSGARVGEAFVYEALNIN
jgi:hypothetical protein